MKNIKKLNDLLLYYIQQRMYKKIIKEDIYSINDISFSLFCLKIIKMIVMIRGVSISFYTYILFFTFLIDDLYHLLNHI